MAKRRTKIEIDADKIIKAKLNILGERIYEQAKKNSRVAKDTFYKDGSINKAGGTLRDSINYMVKPDTTLTVAQIFYGKFQKPNELVVAINDNIDETSGLIITEINDQLLANFKTK
jgi:hypothetical protein